VQADATRKNALAEITRARGSDLEASRATDREKSGAAHPAGGARPGNRGSAPAAPPKCRARAKPCARHGRGYSERSSARFAPQTAPSRFAFRRAAFHSAPRLVPLCAPRPQASPRDTSPRGDAARDASLVAPPAREARDALRRHALVHREARLRREASRCALVHRHQARIERSRRDEQRLKCGTGDVGSDLLGHVPSTFRARFGSRSARRGSSAHTSPVRAGERLSRALTAHLDGERTTRGRARTALWRDDDQRRNARALARVEPSARARCLLND